MFSARVEADSVSSDGVRLTTLVIQAPRFILPSLLTHRALSRNAASSRAIPVGPMTAAVEADPFVPEAFGRSQKGMTAGDPVDPKMAARAERVWRSAAANAVASARALAEMGIHKEWCNRLIEPFAWTTVVVTATDWQNFFALRIHPDAQPEMCKIATLMRDAMARCRPQAVSPNQPVPWHLPFIDLGDADDSYLFATADTETLKLVSVGRAARVSYLTHDGRRDPQADVALARRLMEAKPPHSSPLEHVATPAPGRWANFRGWKQFRLDLPGNVVEEAP